MRVRQFKAMTAWCLVAAMTFASPGMAALAREAGDVLEGELGKDYKLVRLDGTSVGATFSNALVAVATGSNEASSSNYVLASPTDASASNITDFPVDIEGNSVIPQDGEEMTFLTEENLMTEAGDAGLKVPEGKTAFWLEKDGDLNTIVDFGSDGYGLTKNVNTLYLKWGILPTINEALGFAEGSIKVLGLPDGTTMAVNPLGEKKTTGDLQKALQGTSYTGIGAENTLQLDLTVNGKMGGPVTVIMDEFPETFKEATANKSVIAIHYADGGKVEVVDVVGDTEEGYNGSGEEVTYTVGGKFTLTSFSPVILAAVDKLADVTIQNVPGGFVRAYSQIDGVRTYVPINESVKIPVGTKLWIRAHGIEDARCTSLTARAGDEEPASIDYGYTVPDASTVITATFAQEDTSTDEDWSGYEVEIEPDYVNPGSVTAKMKAFYYPGGDQKWKEVPATDWALVEEDSDYLQNEYFSLTPGGTLTSKRDIPAGEYTIDVTFKDNGKLIETDKNNYLRVNLQVGSRAYLSAYMGHYTDSKNRFVRRGDTVETGSFSDDTNFGAIKSAIFGKASVTQVAMYGYDMAGWKRTESEKLPTIPIKDADTLGELVTGTPKTLTAYACFEKNGQLYDPEFKPLGNSSTTDPTPTPGGNGGGSGGGSGSGSSSGSYTSAMGDTMFGTWEKTELGWRFRLTDGTYAANAWGMIKGVWYFFGADSYMATGWIFNNGRWYYLNEAEGGGQGAMLTGWQLIKDKWYYLNTVSDGTRGAMLNTQWVGEYYLGDDGAWIQDMKKQ